MATPAPDSRHLLLVGQPGAGKTSVLQKALSRLTRVRFGGYFTRTPDTASNDRQVVVVRGKEREVTDRMLLREHRQARLTVFDAVSLVEHAIPAVLEALEHCQVAIIDGLGELECRQARFVAAVRRAFDGLTPVVATAPSLDVPLVRELAGRQDIRVLEVTTQNRCTLDSRVADELMRILRSTSCA